MSPHPIALIGRSQGQMRLMGFGVAPVLERLVGLDGKPSPAAGLHSPSQPLDPDRDFARLDETGGRILESETT